MNVWEWAQYVMYLYSFSFTLILLYFSSRRFNAEGSENGDAGAYSSMFCIKALRTFGSKRLLLNNPSYVS